MAMMTGRVLLVCVLCVLWCGAGGGDADGSAVEYSLLRWRAQLRKGCAEEVGRRTGGEANASAVEECLRQRMDSVRAVVDGRRRWRRQHSAVAAAADGGSGNDEDRREENDDKLRGVSFSGQKLQAEKNNPAGGREEFAKVPGGENNLKADKSEPNFEKDKANSVVNPANPTGIQGLADLSLTVAGDSQNPKHAEHGLFNANPRLVGGVSKDGQTEGENGRGNQPPPPPSPKEGTGVGLSKPLGLTEKRIPTPVEENLRPRAGSHSHEKEMLQTKDSSGHEEGETISSDTQRSASKEIPEATTPLSASESGSGIAGSTVGKGGVNNPQPPAASVTQHNSAGDTGPAALPASTSELQTEEMPNAGIIATTHDDNDSSPAASTAERPTVGTRSTQTSGDASDLEQSNNDDVNDDVAHNGKTVEFETASGNRDTEADNDERYTTVPENVTNKKSNTEITADSDSSTAVTHTTSPLLLLLLVVCAAAAAVVAA
ncbi:mucin-associated surface protein [Trypanosoma cruzi cruzi]|nr:mucin-associated surface protein [Trypanosoma cruzi cruzi]